MAKAVLTNMDPEDINDVLLETFTKWVNFALGEGSLGGRTLGLNTKQDASGPSGRLAAALRAETDQDGNVVAIYLDQDDLGAGVNKYLMQGHRAFSLKNKMLRPGLPGVHKTQNKKGPNWLYRYIPIASKPKSPMTAFRQSKNLVNLFTSEVTDHGGMIRLNRNAARIWTKNYERAHIGPVRIRTMSNKPGSRGWVIPSMPAFNVGKLLRDTLPSKVKGRVII